MRWLILTTIVAVLFAACKPTTPKGIIGEGDMEDLLYDYHVARAMASQSSSNNEVEFNQEVYILAALKKHGYTKADFDTSLVYYYTRVDKFEKIYTRVTQRLNDKAAALGASVGEMDKFSTLSANGDTANVWNDATALLLMPRPGYNVAEFTLQSDTSYHKGDTYQFNMKTNFIYKSGNRDATIYMAVRYDNDSISTHTTRSSSSGFSTLRIVTSREHQVKDIRTFLYLMPSNESAGSNDVMFASQIQLIRFHAKDLPAPVASTAPADSLKAQRDTTVAVKKDDRTDGQKTERMEMKPVQR